MDFSGAGHMATPDFKKRVIDLLSGTFAANGYYGFPDLGTNSALVASILTSPSYSDGERTKLYNWFAGSPVRVLNEYPRDTAELPAVFVWRLSDAESSGRNILGDYLGVFASALCVLHCALTPLALLIPFFTQIPHLDDFHYWMIAVVALPIIFSLIPGFAQHRKAIVLLFGLTGFVCFLVSIFWVGL